MSKEPQEITLKQFSELSDAPTTGGKGGSAKKINWDAVQGAVLAKPMTNPQVFEMIIGDKDQYLFDAGADDPNPGTIWTKLNGWVKDKTIRKAIDKKGNIFYGPTG